MNTEWLRNKSHEKFYPVTHEKAVLCGDNSDKTLDTRLAEIDSSINGIQIGGRNLLLNTLREVTTNGYRITSYTPSTPLVVGEKYVATLCITPAEGVQEIRLYASAGMAMLAILKVSGTSRQIVSCAFTMPSYWSGQTPEDNIFYANVELYRFPNDGTVTGDTTIHWIKLEKGNIATDWTPAPEDVDNSIKAVGKETTVNLLNPTLQTTTINGITCTKNADGSYTLTGTSTEVIDSFISTSTSMVKDTKYKLLGVPADVTDDALFMYVMNGTESMNDKGDGKVFTYTGDTTTTKIIHLVVNKNKTLDNLVVKPMLTTNLDATYDDFVTYTGDSGRLNGDVAEIQENMTTIELGTDITD